MANENIVSQPPLTTPILDEKTGMLNRTWSIWFRDIYRRVAYKGGNAIDDNIETTEDLIVAITLIAENLVIVEQGLSTHEGLEEAHGSNGNIVGFDDFSTEIAYGLVKKMSALANAAESTVSVVAASVGVAPAAYSQAHSQALADLSNANKSAINNLVSDVNAAIVVLNNLLAKSKSSGQMSL